jgi:hypothetical protein
VLRLLLPLTAVAAAVVAADDAAAVAPATDVAPAALLPPSTELPWPELLPMAALALASLETQIVSLLAALLPEWEFGVVAPRARPLVTLWKFNRTSPSADEIRVALCAATAWPADCKALAW